MEGCSTLVFETEGLIGESGGREEELEIFDGLSFKTWCLWLYILAFVENFRLFRRFVQVTVGNFE